MKTLFANSYHTPEESSDQPLHKTLGARATAALAAGCLALSLCPAIALAAPGGQGGDMEPQQGGNPPAAAQQQAPGGQQMGGDQQALQGGQQGPSGRQPGANNELPEIPEGGVNVQAVIDSVRDVLRHYDASSLESADFTDETFLASLTEYVKSAVEQRMEMFANGMQPSGVQAPGASVGAQAPTAAADAKAPSDQAGDSSAAADASQAAPEAPAAPASNAVSASVLAKIVEFLAGFFS